MAADPAPSEHEGAVRVYVPMTLATVETALRTGTVPARQVHAVTPALARWYEGEDVEELELAALTDAAQVSLVHLAAERPSPGGAGRPHGSAPSGLATRARRVVLAADAVVERGPAGAPTGGTLDPARDPARDPAHDPAPDPVPGRATGLSVVGLLADLPWSAVVSAHLDEEDAEPDVAAAVVALVARGERAGLPAGPAGQDDDETVRSLEDAEACDLLWYAPSELPGLLEDLAGEDLAGEDLAPR